MNQYILEIEEEVEGQRVDKYLADIFQERSRSYLQKILKDGAVTKDGKPLKASYKLSAGEEIRLEIPEAEELAIEAEDLALDIVYEDEDVILVNKPKNMVVHPSAGHATGTLVNGLMYHCKEDLSGINGIMRPGIVHRIDKDTTGILIVCKNDYAHNKIAVQLKEHTVNRCYRALVHGNVKEDEGTVHAALNRHPVDRKKMAITQSGGKDAITHYKVLERFGTYTYIECRLETGRTHQIRVHLSSIGHPLLGDTIYGSGKSPFKTDGQTLHAMTLGFIHPRTEEYMEFSTPLPEYFERFLNRLRNI